jgi:acetyltransferase-like isoleucine patch superfamily enzyme
MLVIGVGALFADLLICLSIDYPLDSLAIYNNYDGKYPAYLEKDVLVLHDENEVARYFREKDNRFIIAVGDNTARKNIKEKFTMLGGKNVTFISSLAVVGKHAKISDTGVIVMNHTSISSEAEIAEGNVIYMLCGLGHKTVLGEYNLVSAKVVMSITSIGSFNDIGIGVSFVPGKSIGNHCTIGTGAVITKSFGDNTILLGNPARALSKNES